ncbi:hypothetical protein GGH12_000739 [Coemansia sp. RSA 1822]|nr:hypothetical protein LPJ76_004672 [Coemansia sp. RSA 638]KAJ2544952.1 hypothetical protein GGF49_000862 [Coemansia sp. RSA 1853]KAJ2566585.1 hypothetical protein GGH12_000739 [Coemansia sp. RSA 1822]
MSSRAVRRALKERGYDDMAETTALIEKQVREMESEKDDGGSAEPVNMFDLLGGDAAEASESEDSVEAIVEHEPKQETKPAKSKKTKRSKNKKGKGKGKEKAEDMSMAEFEAHLKKLDAELPQAEEAKKAQGAAGRGAALGVELTAEQQQNRALLVVDAKQLDAEAEIKRLFGSAAVQGAGQGGRRGMPRGLAMRRQRLALSHPKATWPPMVAAGIEMQQVGVDEETGGHVFAVEHTERFRTVQIDFLSAVMTNDADAIAGLAYHHPYHVDALLQLSEILKQTGGDFIEAGTLVERALYAFETGFASRFSITNGLGRLDFRRIESRGLFLALFRHMQFLARRGCWRTAFEVNKALLALDPVRDPYGALLTLDFHALKSRQYEYVRRMATEWTWSRIDLLPGWAYSRALAEFMLERNGAERSADLLVEAILVFPSVVPVLWARAGLEVDAAVAEHPYFQQAHIAGESGMTHMQLLEQLFVERSSALFRTPEVGRWLQEGLLLALELIELGGRTAGDIKCSESVVQRRREAERLNSYVVPERISRHVLVSDMDALKAGLPESVRLATSYAFDPLPPSDDINVYNEVMGGRMMFETMPGAFGADLGDLDALGDLDGLDGDATAVQGLLLRIQNLLGGGELETDPGTSSDESDLGADERAA